MLPGRDDPTAAVSMAIPDDEEEEQDGGDAALFGGESQITYDGSEADDDEYRSLAGGAPGSCDPTDPPLASGVPSLGKSLSAPAGPPLVSRSCRPPSFGRSASFSAPFVSRRERELERAQQAAADTLSYEEASQEANVSLAQYYIEDVD